LRVRTAIAITALAGVILLISCQSKETCEGCNDGSLHPPLGLSFSVPSGDVSYFNLFGHGLVDTIRRDGWMVMAAEVSINQDRVAVADGGNNRIAVMRLPDFLEITSSGIGGEPMDIDMDVSNQHVYVITRNGSLWRYNVATGVYDTLELALFPRRFAMRPPDRLEAWIVSEGEFELQIVSLQQFRKTDSLVFPSSPTDVQFSPDGARAYIGFKGDTGSVIVYQTSNREQIAQHQTGIGPFELAVSPDGRFLAASDSVRGSVHFWDTITDECWNVPVGGSAGRVRFARWQPRCFVLSQMQNAILGISMSPDGPVTTDTIYVAPYAREIALWENVQ